jgi:BTB/POZ domain
MFESGLAESIKNEIRIEDMEPEVVELMLQFIYKGEIQIPEDLQGILKLLDCSEKYELDGLKARAITQLIETVRDETAGEVAMVAFKYNLPPEGVAIIKGYCTK